MNSTPMPVGPPPGGYLFVCVYNNQQHFAYIDQQSNLQDAWYDNSGWHLQQLTQGPADEWNEYIIPTPGPNALGNLFVSVYNDQQHFVFIDGTAGIQDVWYDNSGWHLQQLTQAPGVEPNEYVIPTPAPQLALGNLFVSVYMDQQHFTYGDFNSNIQDVWYDGDWHLQQLTRGPADEPNEYIIPTPGPPIGGELSVSVYNNQQHFTYVDQQNNVQDAWYDNSGWHLQQLTQGPADERNEYVIPTPGPNASGILFVSVYNDQQHFAYIDQQNNVQDAWYDNSGWHLQQLTQGPADELNEYIVPTPGPPMAGLLFVSVYENQQHFTYVDQQNNVQDVWYDNSGWHLQQLTQGPADEPNEYIIPTPGPPNGGPLFVSVYNNQHHFAYIDLYSNIQDVWYDGSWHLQQINSS